ncbi:putative phosphatase [Trypanosoma theileri]|uniref:Putative phosphatase n=1 Tax=Trypanosoma theileri TaxID=67003 RepID=A0A1X0NUR4_9TRYP|nr:putative phosphatase [Trypanosoma theileri]ORC88435.1 putative phosphatase [Trypanosoma theileri]
MLGGLGDASTVPPEDRSAKDSSRHVRSTKAKSKKFKKVDESKVDGFLDRARQGIHCSFCGGVKCKHESWEAMKEKRADTAIEGLNSNWVGTDVIASQRPSTSLFLKYLLIQQFKEKQITGVFNLQEKGEHASCGPDGVYTSTGYSYNGEEDLMRHNISYYEFPWPDMTAPQQDIVLRSVQVMDFHVKNSGKVLVHCHAGLGRTGLMIACYLVYSQHMPSAEVIRLVRQERPGAIQTSRQAQFIHDFERHLWRLTQAFRVEISDAIIDVELFLQRQRLVLHGEQADYYRFVPMVIHVILCRLINLTRENASNAELALLSIASSASPGEATLSACRVSINRRRFNVNAMTDVSILSFLVCDWFRSMSTPALSVEACNAIVEIKRKAPGERESLSDEISRIMSKSVRHTLGMVVSAFYVISLPVKSSVKSYAFRCLADSFTHAHNPVKLRHSPVERELIYEFFLEWGESIKDLYFNVNSVDKQHSTIRKIATASSAVLQETSHSDLGQRALTFYPADLVAEDGGATS